MTPAKWRELYKKHPNWGELIDLAIYKTWRNTLDQILTWRFIALSYDPPETEGDVAVGGIAMGLDDMPAPRDRAMFDEGMTPSEAAGKIMQQWADDDLKQEDK